MLAAAICPKMQAMASCPMMRTVDKSVSSHEEMVMGESGDMQMTPTVTEGEANAIEQPIASCPHCFRQSEPPTTSVVATKGVEQSRRDAGAIMQQALKAITLPTSSFAPPVASRQHAPPSASTPRHILISVFLI